jgi:general secretion pathway protein D
MTNADLTSLKRLTAVVAVALLMAGCGGSAYKKGFGAAQNGNWDEAVEQYRVAVQEHPNNPEYKIALERAMLTASQQHVDAARLAEARMQWEEALREYRRASEMDPPNRMLAAKVSDIEHRIRDEVEAAARSRSTLEQMRETARRVGPPPLFNLNTVLPAIRLADTSLRTILNGIAQAAGINVQYDTSFNDRPFSVNLENVTLQDALNQVLLANGLFFKVLNPRTIIVAQDSLANRTKYEDQVIRTFYLNHADSQELVQLLNQVGRLGGQQVPPQIAATKSSNTITVRGTTTMVDIIERLIEANDNPRAEVIVDVQILEVNRQRAKQFGLDLGTYAIGASFSPEVDPRGGTATAGWRRDRRHRRSRASRSAHLAGVQRQHHQPRHQHRRLLPRGPAGGRPLPRDGQRNEAHREAAVARLRRNQTVAGARRGGSGSVDDVHPDSDRRRQLQPADLL